MGLSVWVAMRVALIGSVVPLKSDKTHKGALINFLPESTCTTKTSFLEILQTGIKVQSGLCAPLQSASPPAYQSTSLTAADICSDIPLIPTARSAREAPLAPPTAAASLARGQPSRLHEGT